MVHYMKELFGQVGFIMLTICTQMPRVTGSLSLIDCINLFLFLEFGLIWTSQQTSIVISLYLKHTRFSLIKLKTWWQSILISNIIPAIPSNLFFIMRYMHTLDIFLPCQHTNFWKNIEDLLLLLGAIVLGLGHMRHIGRETILLIGNF